MALHGYHTQIWLMFKVLDISSWILQQEKARRRLSSSFTLGSKVRAYLRRFNLDLITNPVQIQAFAFTKQ